MKTIKNKYHRRAHPSIIFTLQSLDKNEEKSPLLTINVFGNRLPKKRKFYKIKLNETETCKRDIRA